MKSTLLLFLSLFLLIACSNPKQNDAQEPTTEGTEELTPYQELHPNGAIKIEGQMLNGERHGPWVAYYESGIKWSENNYHKGTLNGKHKAYFDDGMLRITGAYIDDMKRGEWRFFDRTGKMVKRMDFNQDPPADLEVY